MRRIFLGLAALTLMSPQASAGQVLKGYMEAVDARTINVGTPKTLSQMGHSKGSLNDPVAVRLWGVGTPAKGCETSSGESCQKVAWARLHSQGVAKVRCEIVGREGGQLVGRCQTGTDRELSEGRGKDLSEMLVAWAGMPIEPEAMNELRPALKAAEDVRAKRAAEKKALDEWKRQEAAKVLQQLLKESGGK